MNLMSKPTFVIHGNCQGERIFKTLLESPGLISPDFEMRYFREYLDLQATLRELDHEALGRAAVLILQVPVTKSHQTILESVPKNCKIIRYPYFHCSSLWPLVCHDPRNKSLPEPIATRLKMAHGKYPQGDRLALKLLLRGLTTKQAFAEYLRTDITQMISLDRLYELDLKNFRQNDLNSDIQGATFFESNFRTNRMFWKVDNAAWPTFEFLVNRVLDYCSAIGVAKPLNVTLGPGGQEYHQVPLHPQVISHFDLTWAKPNDRYLYWGFGPFSFFEWLENYLEFSVPGIDQALSQAQAEVREDRCEARI